MANSRKFTMVSPALWGSQRFVSLPGAEAKLLYMYFLTCEHMTSAGAYRIKQGYALTDLAWPEEKYSQAIADLILAELIAYDGESEVVYILRWFKHNPPQNDKHALGCRRQIEDLDSELIAHRCTVDFEEANSARTHALDLRQVTVTPSLRSKLGNVNQH